MFEFSGLPAGSYFIQTTIVWSTGQAYTQLQGANLMLQVGLTDGER
ncbi:MAG: hypothetical protein NWS01_00010 [Burkholderiales bacterium]|nr:hypothetical protein [Burkholderiales bacterium]